MDFLQASGRPRASHGEAIFARRFTTPAHDRAAMASALNAALPGRRPVSDRRVVPCSIAQPVDASRPALVGHHGARERARQIPVNRRPIAPNIDFLRLKAHMEQAIVACDGLRRP
jgi:hypothetical protein